MIIFILMDGCSGGSSAIFFFMGKMGCHLAFGSLGVLSLKCSIHASTSGLQGTNGIFSAVTSVHVEGLASNEGTLCEWSLI